MNLYSAQDVETLVCAWCP